MELRHLRYFVAVADELHFGRAADSVFVAQPTLSQQIQAFEDELGARLFERSRRGVALTPAGEALRPYAHRILREAEQAEKAVHAVREGLAGYLRICYAASVMRSGLPQAIQAFRQQAPDVEIELLERGSRTQVETVRAGEADVGFVLLPVDERGLRSELVSEAPTVVVLSRGHRLAGRERVPLRELADEPHVLWSRDVSPGAFDGYMRACHQVGFAPRVVQEIRHMESLLGLVAAGLGLAIAHQALTASQYPGVTYAVITEPEVPLNIGVIWREDDDAPVVHRFLDVVRDTSALGSNASE